MAGYTVLANRYRPHTFEEVVGQGDIALVLQRSLETGRAGHAYLFSGPRGVGKTSMARILAKSLNCLEDELGHPCGSCAVCTSIDRTGDALDVVEIDGASHNKVENVRDLIENLRFRPVEARYRIYVVDEVHMLSTSAFNALLKTLEEPPSHAKFILCTTEPLKVPETIRSRCQMFDFRRIAAPVIRDRLAMICEREDVPVPAGLLEGVARHSKGGMRDALTLLDQLITFGDGQPSREDYERLTGKLSPQILHGLLSAALGGDGAAALAACEQATERGARAADLLEQLTEVLEGVLVLTAGGRPADRADDELTALRGLADTTNIDHVVAMLDVLVEASRRLKQRHDARLVVELAVLTLARLPLLVPVADLLGDDGPEPRKAAAPVARPAARPATTTPSAPPAEQREPGPGPASEPAPTPAAPTAATPPAPQHSEDVRKVLDEIGRSSRSLRLELQRYRSVRLEGDELVLEPAAGAAPGLFDVDKSAVLDRIAAAARAVTGQDIRVRVAISEAAPPVTPTSKARDDVAARVRKQWPGAEQVDM